MNQRGKGRVAIQESTESSQTAQPSESDCAEEVNSAAGQPGGTDTAAGIERWDVVPELIDYTLIDLDGQLRDVETSHGKWICVGLLIGSVRYMSRHPGSEVRWQYLP